MSKHKNSHGLGSGSWDNIKTVIYAVVFVIILRIFWFEPFNIPSGSMESTLLVGDYLIVTKYDYGYSVDSVPLGLMPNIPGRIFMHHKPELGDVVVFKKPPQNDPNFIKRVIGLPGDHIQMIGGQLYINDKLVERERLDDLITVDQYGNSNHVPRYIETLPNGVKHTILKVDGDTGFVDNTPVFVVPENHYFVMGDNRGNSKDSRFAQPDGVGYVPQDNLVGKARFVFYSVNDEMEWYKPWTWPQGIRYNRILSSIH